MNPAATIFDLQYVDLFCWKWLPEDRCHKLKDGRWRNLDDLLLLQRVLMYSKRIFLISLHHHHIHHQHHNGKHLHHNHHLYCHQSEPLTGDRIDPYIDVWPFSSSLFHQQRRLQISAQWNVFFFFLWPSSVNPRGGCA